MEVQSRTQESCSSNKPKYNNNNRKKNTLTTLNGAAFLWRFIIKLLQFLRFYQNCSHFFTGSNYDHTAKHTVCQERCCVGHPCGCWNVITWTLGVDECWTVHVPTPGSHQPDWFSCEPSGHWRRDWRTHQLSPDSVHTVMQQLKRTSTRNDKTWPANIFKLQNSYISVEFLAGC